MNNRLDNELITRNLFTTRSKAKKAITEGLIYCNDKQITKPSYLVTQDTKIEIRGEIMPYVSRGGLKLEKALNTFDVNLKGKAMLDIGSSTGGFCDCALKNDISNIIAVDVGTNQLDISLRDNPKIKLYEQTDFRTIDTSLINHIDIITIDVSFISVTKLIEKIKDITNVEEIICLIKPQFECGKEIADKYKGIIKNKEVHHEVIKNLIKSFNSINYNCNGLTYSPIKGGNGNIEYLAYFKKEKQNTNFNIKKIIDEAFSNLA